jgi:hypothetical protein
MARGKREEGSFVAALLSMTAKDERKSKKKKQILHFVQDDTTVEGPRRDRGGWMLTRARAGGSLEGAEKGRPCAPWLLCRG